MSIDGHQALLPSLRSVLAAWLPVALAAVVVLVLLVAIPMVPRTPEDQAPPAGSGADPVQPFRSQSRALR